MRQIFSFSIRAFEAFALNGWELISALTCPTIVIIMNPIGDHMTLDSEQLRHAMRAWTTGVTIVTAAHDGQCYGMTVNSFTSISLDPPLISVALRKLTHTHELVEKSGEFAITVLSVDQLELSDRFAGRHPHITDRFEGVATETLAIPAPLLSGGIAFFNCRVVNSVPVGENTLFVAEVIAARGKGEGEPLAYHNRVYWKLASTPNPPQLQ